MVAINRWLSGALLTLTEEKSIFRRAGPRWSTAAKPTQDRHMLESNPEIQRASMRAETRKYKQQVGDLLSRWPPGYEGYLL